MKIPIKLILCLIVIISFFSKTNAQWFVTETDISGQWAGVLTQPNSKRALAEEYPFKMDISQKGDSIWGTTSIEINNTVYYANISFYGKISNNIVSFQETEIFKQNIQVGGYFCIKSGTLLYNVDNKQLIGNWNSTGGCGPGNIFMVKNEPPQIQEEITIEETTVTEEIAVIPEIVNVEGVEVNDNKLNIENIYFETAKSEITENAEAELNKIYKFMIINKEVNIFISGHTDNIGDETELLNLSEKRVEAVKKYLVDKGIDKSRISGKGYGATKPISTKDTDIDHAKNRRIEFEIIY